MRRVLFGTTAVAVVAAAGLLPAAAAPTAFGSLYEVASSIASDATPANVPAGPATVTFTAPSDPLSFNPTDNPSVYLIGSWLATGSAHILSGSSHLGNSIDNTLINFTGSVTVTHGQTFTAGHDDGMTLVIDGISVINVPGPTALDITTATYTGPSGTFPFQLVYGECCGAPAALFVDLPLVSPVPEPTPFAVLGVGLLGLGLLRWKRSASG